MKHKGFIITTVLLAGMLVFSCDALALPFAQQTYLTKPGGVYKVDNDTGEVTLFAAFDDPRYLTVDHYGNLYTTERRENQQREIYKIDKLGNKEIIYEFSGGYISDIQHGSDLYILGKNESVISSIMKLDEQGLTELESYPYYGTASMGEDNDKIYYGLFDSDELIKKIDKSSGSIEDFIPSGHMHGSETRAFAVNQDINSMYIGMTPQGHDENRSWIYKVPDIDNPNPQLWWDEDDIIQGTPLGDDISFSIDEDNLWVLDTDGDRVINFVGCSPSSPTAEVYKIVNYELTFIGMGNEIPVGEPPSESMLEGALASSEESFNDILIVDSGEIIPESSAIIYALSGLGFAVLAGAGRRLGRRSDKRD